MFLSQNVMFLVWFVMNSAWKYVKTGREHVTSDIKLKIEALERVTGEDRYENSGSGLWCFVL